MKNYKTQTTALPVLDQNMNIVGSGMDGGTISKYIPWQFGVKQGIQAKKVRASSGFFKKLTGGTQTISNLSQATITTSLFNGGTVANTSIQNGTFPSMLVTGGTINNVIMGSPTVTSGTFNNGVIGTPTLTGGTVNAGTYQVGGSAGITGSIVYVKTVSPGTTFGTLSFIGGIITQSQ